MNAYRDNYPENKAFIGKIALGQVATCPYTICCYLSTKYETPFSRIKKIRVLHIFRLIRDSKQIIIQYLDNPLAFFCQK